MTVLLLTAKGEVEDKVLGLDSGNYFLALRLTDNFHNELVNDLIPAVESKYITFAENTGRDGRNFARTPICSAPT